MCGGDTEFEKSLVITGDFANLQRAKKMFETYAPQIYTDYVLHSPHQDGSQPANMLFGMLVTQQYKNVFYETDLKSGLSSWDNARKIGYWNAHTRPLEELTQEWLEETQKRKNRRHEIIRHRRENKGPDNVIDFVGYARRSGHKLIGWYLDK